MHPLGLTGFHHQTDLGTQAGTDQMMVHGGGGEQGGDGDVIGVQSAVGEDQDVVAATHHIGRLAAEIPQGPRHAVGTTLDRVADAQSLGAEGPIHMIFDAADPLQIGIAENRALDLQSFVGAAAGQVEQVGSGTDQRDQRHHQFLADRVDRRVGDLREFLFEVVVQQLGPVGQHGGGDVTAHGADRVFAVDRHRYQESPQVFLGITESLLAAQQGLRIGGHRSDFGRQVLEPDLGGVQPSLIGMFGRQLGLDLIVIDDATLLKVDQQHLARLQAPFLDDLFLGDRQHAHFRSHDDLVVVGHQITGGTQAVAIQGGADLAAIGEGDGGWAVPRFHQGGVVFVKRAALGVHQRIVGPGFRHHQHHGMRQRITAGQQQLQGIIEGGGVGGAIADQRP